MAEWLKERTDAAGRASTDRAVRESVEQILADIAPRGDDALRELSIKV